MPYNISHGSDLALTEARTGRMGDAYRKNRVGNEK